MLTLDLLYFPLTLVAALGCGLIAGFFFAFSTFVMRALSRLQPDAGLAAMQSINVAVLNPWFLGPFLGTALVCLTASVLSLVKWGTPDAPYLLVGGTVYLVGCFLVTIVFNVPRNEDLATVAPSEPEAESRWTGYVTSWTAWNHVRTGAAFAAAVSFCFALACA